MQSVTEATDRGNWITIELNDSDITELHDGRGVSFEDNKGNRYVILQVIPINRR